MSNYFSLENFIFLGKLEIRRNFVYFAPGLKKFTRKTKSVVIPGYENFFILGFISSHPKAWQLFFRKNARNFFRVGFFCCIIHYSPSRLPHSYTPLTENPRSTLDCAFFCWLNILNISTFTSIRLLIMATGMPNNANNMKNWQILAYLSHLQILWPNQMCKLL